MGVLFARVLSGVIAEYSSYHNIYWMGVGGSNYLCLASTKSDSIIFKRTIRHAGRRVLCLPRQAAQKSASLILSNTWHDGQIRSHGADTYTGLPHHLHKQCDLQLFLGDCHVLAEWGALPL